MRLAAMSGLFDKPNFLCMFAAKEKIQVGIVVRIPFRPAKLPIWPAAIAGKFIEHPDGAGVAAARSRVENKLGLAIRFYG